MPSVIWCPDCAGIGHPPTACECTQPEEFLDGCCTLCAGHGIVETDDEDTNPNVVPASGDAPATVEDET